MISHQIYPNRIIIRQLPANLINESNGLYAAFTKINFPALEVLESDNTI